MENTEEIRTDQRNGNLHIRVEGLFTPKTAASLTSVMDEHYQGKGNIFIRTGRITGVTPDSRHAFSSLLDAIGLPKGNIYFTGAKGLDISHDGGRVIVSKKKKHGHQGCGRCKNCTCHKRKAA